MWLLVIMVCILMMGVIGMVYIWMTGVVIGMVCIWMTGVVMGNHGMHLNDWCGYW